MRLLCLHAPVLVKISPTRGSSRWLFFALSRKSMILPKSKSTQAANKPCEVFEAGKSTREMRRISLFCTSIPACKLPCEEWDSAKQTAQGETPRNHKKLLAHKENTLFDRPIAPVGVKYSQIQLRAGIFSWNVRFSFFFSFSRMVEMTSCDYVC